MSEADKAYTFRPYKKEDLNFISSSWGNSYYMGNACFRILTPDEFHAYHRPIRDRFFSRPTATVIVCVSSSDPDLILGWIALEEIPYCKARILHYIYIKQAFKEEKIAEGLLMFLKTDKPIVYTHLTERATKILKRNPDKYSGFSFVPHLV